MTHQTRPKRDWLFTCIIASATLVAGIGAGAITANTASNSTNSTACATAISNADQAIEIYSEGFMIAADAVSAITTYDSTTINRSTAGLHDAADRLDPVLTEYYATSSQCLGE